MPPKQPKEEKPNFEHPQSQTTAPAQGQIAGIDTAQSQQIQQNSAQIAEIRARRVNLNTDIIGLFETVSVAPTLVPAGPYDQVKIYSNSGTFRLYVYDAVGNAWYFASLT